MWILRIQVIQIAICAITNESFPILIDWNVIVSETVRCEVANWQSTIDNRVSQLKVNILSTWNSS